MINIRKNLIISFLIGFLGSILLLIGFNATIPKASASDFICEDGVFEFSAEFTGFDKYSQETLPDTSAWVTTGDELVDGTSKIGGKFLRWKIEPYGGFILFLRNESDQEIAFNVNCTQTGVNLTHYAVSVPLYVFPYNLSADGSYVDFYIPLGSIVIDVITNIDAGPCIYSGTYTITEDTVIGSGSICPGCGCYEITYFEDTANYKQEQLTVADDLTVLDNVANKFLRIKKSGKTLPYCDYIGTDDSYIVEYEDGIYLKCFGFDTLTYKLPCKEVVDGYWDVYFPVFSVFETVTVYGYSISITENSRLWSNAGPPAGTVLDMYLLTAPQALSAPILTNNFSGVSWKPVENAVGYMICVDGVEKEVDLNTTSQFLSNDSFKIKALGDGVNYLDSEWTKDLMYYHVYKPEVTIDENGLATWESILNSAEYVLEVSGSVVRLPFGTNSYQLSNGDTLRMCAMSPKDSSTVMYSFSGWTDTVTYTAPVVDDGSETPDDNNGLNDFLEDVGSGVNSYLKIDAPSVVIGLFVVLSAVVIIIKNT